MISGQTVEVGRLEGVVQTGTAISGQIDSEPLALKASLRISTDMAIYMRDHHVMVEAPSVDPEDVGEFGFEIDELGRLIYSYDDKTEAEFDMNKGHLRVLSIQESPEMIHLDGSIRTSGVISGELNSDSIILTASINTYSSSQDIYSGEYVIKPTVDDQILQTKEKLMTDDVTVKAIPYYEVSNEYGTTIVIGE